MYTKTITFFCIQMFLAHTVISQCVYPGGEYLRAFSPPSVGVPPCNGLAGNGLVYGGGLGIGNGYAGASLGAPNIEVIPTSGGAFPVSSTSALAANGISVASENAFEGSLFVAGELPFLSAVAIEGALPSAGAGAVNYGCGNGISAITSGISNSAGAVGLGPAGVGYGAGVAAVPTGVAGLGAAGGWGCGCGGGRY